jgi:hypothetical protein
LSPLKLPVYSLLPTFTRAAYIFQEPDDTNQVPHSGPTIVSRHRTKFSCPGHLVRCICVPLVSALRVGQVCDVISPSVITASWTASRYGVSLLLFSASQPRQPTGLSELCVSGCSFHNYTSQQLAVHLRRIFLQGTLQCPSVSTNVPSTNYAWPAVCSDCMCYV